MNGAMWLWREGASQPKADRQRCRNDQPSCPALCHGCPVERRVTRRPLVFAFAQLFNVLAGQKPSKDGVARRNYNQFR
jgi:hypothetical protein